MDDTSLEAAAGSSQVAAGEEEAGRGRRRESFQGCCRGRPPVGFGGEDRRLARGQRPEPVRKRE